MATGVNYNLVFFRSENAMRDSEQACMDTSQVEKYEVNFSGHDFKLTLTSSS